MFYNIFLTTFALAFGKQPSRALDGEKQRNAEKWQPDKIFLKKFWQFKKWLYLCKVFGSQKCERKKA